ncbi:uncharacterized protein ASPGLDRAFT_63789 [Aspergillus glaucus CBS 516.65]|uniref:F-box domain-containing protein n=1 Tax=Aspergillus glaucus CBS 516.65 TaxID=1160497 RepID=A0A1L9VUS0_ASPGL|nr:hypothetical protein ASPGLDRAFT_63789 [Aspergillus glaucus CBS 516.65]OJJ87649.1 hypothetical protein ASPGLDRAFT_63789 [Aspergillus glaucus CBS 516.65]
MSLQSNVLPNPNHLCQSNTPLENLPAEIRRHLLSTLDYEGLKALVHASSIYHQQYLLNRHHLLCKCLETTLGSNTTGACAVYQSGLVEFSKTRTEEIITQFLESYGNSRFLSQYSFLKTLILDQVISIVAFHLSIIKPLARYYAGWTVVNLAKDTKDTQDYLSLSSTEETRLTRALYRFQLYCNLFGVSCYRSRRQWMLEFESEVEEIACIYTFAKTTFNQVFDDIRWDVHQDNPRFDGQHRPPTPQGAFNFDSGYTRDLLLERNLSRGLELLHDVLFKIKDHAQLDILDNTPQSRRRRLHPTDQDLKQKRRDPLPFQGGNEEFPPLARTLIWQGTYSNLFGWYIKDDVRSWGYIMWGAARLERTGVKEVLHRQWKACWKDVDPRNRLRYAN